MRTLFDEQLDRLNGELKEMGALCEEAIAAAAKALTGGDLPLADRAIALEAEIDRRERNVEAMCLKLLLVQQPVVGCDLRQISAALKMITDMERIGDQAADIGEIVKCMKGRAGGECGQIAQMAREAIRMVTGSVDAFVNCDLDLAQQVIGWDDKVDGLFDEMKAYIISLIASDPADGGYAVDLLMIAKYFERIADHATNIAEWVVFSVTGVHNGQEEL